MGTGDGSVTYYKATRVDGTDFNTGTVDYGAAFASGDVLRHPLWASVDRRKRDQDASKYLSVSTTATDCTGMSWPCRLFEVEPVGASWTPDAGSLPNKRAVYALRVIREVDATLALGPQGAQLVSLINQASALTETQARRLSALTSAARSAAWAA